MAREIKAVVTGDASGVKTATKEAVAHIKGLDAAVAGFAAGGALAAFNAITGAVQNFIGQLGAAADSFRADQVSAELLQNTLRNTVPHYKENAKALEAFLGSLRGLGYTNEQARNSLAELVGITHDEGEAMELSAVAADLARAKHLDLAQATDIVAKAAVGNGKALKGLGIDIHNAKTGAQLLDAIQKNVKGSAEAYANTSEGKLAVANAKNAESWNRIGSIVARIQAVVLPLVAAAFERVSNFVVSNLVPAFMQVWAAAQQIWSAFMGLLAPAIDYIRDNFDSVKPVLLALAIVVGIVVGIIVLAILAVIAIVVALVAVIVWLVKETGARLTLLQGYWNLLVAFVSGLPARISSAAKGIWDGIWNAFRSMLNMIVHAWNRLHFTLPAVDFLGQHTPSVTLSVPQIPSFQYGTGPGGLPYTGLFYGHKGEAVIPAGRSGGDVHIHMHGMVIDGPAMDRFFREGLARARFAPGT